jgi:O-antigen ligase
MRADAGVGGLSPGWNVASLASAEPALREGRRAFGAGWSYRLLLVFLLLLFANLPLLFPTVALVAPAQGVVIAALAALFIERAVSQQPLRLAWPESHLLLAFLGAAAVSSFSALWPKHAGEQTLVLLRYVIVYLLVVNTVDSWPRLRRTSSVLVAGAMFPALGAIRNYFLTGDLVEGRAGWIGIFENPNDLAYTLVLLFPIAVATALAARGVWAIFGWCAIAAYTTAIFVTFSRGGFLAFCVVVLLCFLRWCGPWARLPGLAVAGAAIAVVVSTSWGRMEGFADLLADATLQQRLATVRAGIEMFVDQPLLGVGLGCSVVGWPLYAPAGAVTEGWLHSHNTIIQVLAETGLLGGAPFLLMVAIALWKANRLALPWRKSGRPEIYRAVSALEISLWGFLACGLAGGHVLSWFPYLVIGLVSAACIIPRPSPQDLAS